MRRIVLRISSITPSMERRGSAPMEARLRFLQVWMCRLPALMTLSLMRRARFRCLMLCLLLHITSRKEAIFLPVGNLAQWIALFPSMIWRCHFLFLHTSWIEETVRFLARKRDEVHEAIGDIQGPGGSRKEQKFEGMSDWVMLTIVGIAYR